MNRIHRPVTGLILLFIAIFIVNARRCGLLGVWLAKGLTLLLGTFGGSLLTFALVTCSLVMIVPWKALGRALHRRPVIHPPVRRPMRERRTVAPRTVAASRTDERNWSLTFAPLAPPEPVEPPKPSLPPAHRMKLDDVRLAMKNFGYKREEYESLVASMDPTLPVEKLIKDGLQALRRN